MINNFFFFFKVVMRHICRPSAEINRKLFVAILIIVSVSPPPAPLFQINFFQTLIVSLKMKNVSRQDKNKIK